MRALVLPVLIVLALAGCTMDESCEPTGVGASARIPFIGEPPDEATLREVLTERGWTLDAGTGVAAHRTLDEGGEVAASGTTPDDAAHPGLVFSTDVRRPDDVAAAQLLAPVAEPIAAGLTERTARPYDVLYAGSGACGSG